MSGSGPDFGRQMGRLRGLTCSESQPASSKAAQHPESRSGQLSARNRSVVATAGSGAKMTLRGFPDPHSHPVEAVEPKRVAARATKALESVRRPDGKRRAALGFGWGAALALAVVYTSSSYVTGLFVLVALGQAYLAKRRSDSFRDLSKLGRPTGLVAALLVLGALAIAGAGVLTVKTVLAGQELTLMSAIFLLGAGAGLFWWCREFNEIWPASGESAVKPETSATNAHAPVPTPAAASPSGREGSVPRVDLTARAEAGRIDQVVGRDREIDEVIEILARRHKGNAVLLGKPGVGKSAVVEGLARRIVDGDVPELLRDCRILGVKANDMVAGASVRGELEQRMNSLLVELRETNGRAILFLDEMHLFFDGEMNQAGQAMKEDLARGAIRVIAATTFDEYKVVERDKALVRRFSPVTVDELSVDETVQVLEGVVYDLSDHHRIEISQEALEAAAALSDRYLKDRQNPDKAIDLVDQAAARAHLAGSGEIVGAQQIAEILSARTGVPLGELLDDERERLVGLEGELQARVIGQDEAITQVAQAMRRARTLPKANRPLASFLLLGPTGVGKTELAEALAAKFFGGNIVRLDMSEFDQPHSTARLFGAPPGYVGHDAGGQLTEPIRRQPHSLILLDELEKAHSDVHQALLSILDAGRMTDGRGEEVDFSNTVIVMTSNVGAQGRRTTREETGRALKLQFSPEFINRIGSKIVFSPLAPEALTAITGKLIDELAERLAAAHQVELRVDAELTEWLAANGADSAYGARPIQRFLEEKLEDPIVTQIIAGEIGKEDAIAARLVDGNVQLLRRPRPTR